MFPTSTLDVHIRYATCQKERTVSYHQYLQSPSWKAKRRKVIERDKTCRRCLVAAIEDVHHLSYEHFRYERLRELVGLCHRCHQIHHGHEPDLLKMVVSKGEQ